MVHVSLLGKNTPSFDADVRDAHAPADQGDALEVATFSPTSALLVSPWIWLTLSTLLLCGLLFVSFRKQRAIELYHEGKAL